MRATPSPRVTAYAVLAAVFLLAALGLRRPELAVLALPFALPLALGLRLARAPEIRVQVDVERATALENDELDVELTVSSEMPVERLELVLVVADGLEVVSGASAQSLRLGWEDERTLELTAPLRPLGQLRDRRRPPPRPRPARPDGLGVPRRPEAAAARLPAPRDAAPDRQTGLDPALHRQRGRAAEGRGDGVRRPAPVRPRRPRPLDQLARERTPRRARRQRAASGAERRRDPLPRHVRGRARRRPLDARPRRARDRDAGGALPRAARPRRARLVRRRPPLADAGDGVDAALPDRRRPARVGDRLQLRLEGRLGDPVTRAAARGAGGRGDAAARRPRRRGARRPARPPLRPRDRRGLARSASPSRARARPTSLRTGSGCCGATRSARATSGSASPSRAGATTRPSTPCSRG